MRIALLALAAISFQVVECRAQLIENAGVSGHVVGFPEFHRGVYNDLKSADFGMLVLKNVGVFNCDFDHDGERLPACYRADKIGNIDFWENKFSQFVRPARDIWNSAYLWGIESIGQRAWQQVFTIGAFFADGKTQSDKNVFAWRVAGVGYAKPDARGRIDLVNNFKFHLGYRQVGPRLSLTNAPGLSYRVLSSQQGLPNEKGANASKGYGSPCGPMHPSGKLSHALLGCEITPVRLPFIFLVAALCFLTAGKGVRRGNPLQVLFGASIGIIGTLLYAGVL